MSVRHTLFAAAIGALAAAAMQPASGQSLRYANQGTLTFLKALKGDKLPKTVDTGFYWYDKTNVDDPKVKAVLYN